MVQFHWLLGVLLGVWFLVFQLGDTFYPEVPPIYVHAAGIGLGLILAWLGLNSTPEDPDEEE